MSETTKAAAGSCRPLESVLLIDDSLTVRVFVDAVLSQAGYRVTTVSDTAAGLSALADAVPDLVLLDVRLPGTDTVAVAAAIRECNVRGETVILLYSGKPNSDATELVARYGAHGYVQKTHDPETLRRTVEDAWRRHHHHGLDART